MIKRHKSVLSATVFSDQVTQLDAYQNATRSASRSEALRRLLDDAFKAAALTAEPLPTPAPEPCQ